jgi:hypothetical protein
LITGAKKKVSILVTGDVGGGLEHDAEGLRQPFEHQLPGSLVLQVRPEIHAIAYIGQGIEGMAHDFLTR